MSILINILAARIRDIVGDNDPAEPVVSQFRLNEVINRNVQLLSSRTIRPTETVQSITLVASTYDYALAAGGLIDSVRQAFLNAQGDELFYLPYEEFNRYYGQVTGAPSGSGKPVQYTLYETPAQVTYIRIGPTPNVASYGPMKVYYSIQPVVLSDSAFGAPSPSISIPFGNELTAGLVSACAAEIVLSMGAANLDRLGIDRGVASLWMGQADQSVKAHNARQLSLGRRQSSVSRRSLRRIKVGW